MIKGIYYAINQSSNMMLHFQKLKALKSGDERDEVFIYKLLNKQCEFNPEDLEKDNSYSSVECRTTGLQLNGKSLSEIFDWALSVVEV